LLIIDAHLDLSLNALCFNRNLTESIRSDLDGGFGTEQTPGDLETISDLHKIAGHLGDMGYGDDDIEKIFNRNWYEFFIRHLPKGE
jgi:microsomal dipeptidase-like Zn-dependent dipeptidase